MATHQLKKTACKYDMYISTSKTKVTGTSGRNILKKQNQKMTEK
jgi:hypothetical protein